VTRFGKILPVGLLFEGLTYFAKVHPIIILLKKLFYAFTKISIFETWFVVGILRFPKWSNVNVLS
jgi:hypothetical protein